MAGKCGGKRSGKRWGAWSWAMHQRPSPLRALSQEWETLSTSADAKAALLRWTRSEPVLRPVASLAGLVECCQDRRDAADANLIIGALLRLADDRLAARTILQVLLPSVAARAHRAGRMFNAPGMSPDSSQLDEWSQEMVTQVLERIRSLAGTSPSWPASQIVEAAWWRVQALANAERRRHERNAPLDAVGPRAAAPDRTAAEELTTLLVQAVTTQVLRPHAAGVIYSTRVMGLSFREVAATETKGVAALRQERVRAERALVDKGS